MNQFFLPFFKVLRLFSVFRFTKVFTRRNMQIPRVLFKLILTVFMIIYVNASAMLTLENYYKMSLHYAEHERLKPFTCEKRDNYMSFCKMEESRMCNEDKDCWDYDDNI